MASIDDACPVNGDCFRETFVAEASRKAEKDALATFSIVCNIDPEDEDEENGFEQDQVKLLTTIRGMEKEFQNENQVQMAKSQEVLRAEVDDLVKSYNGQMTPRIERKFLSTEQLTKLHKTIQQGIFRDFQMKRSNFTLYDKFKVNLEERLDAEFEKIGKSSAAQSEKTLLEIGSKLHNFVKMYREEMTSFQGINSNELQRHHKDQKKSALDQYKSIIFILLDLDNDEDDPDDLMEVEHPAAQKFLNDLSKEIDQIYPDFEASFRQRCSDVMRILSTVEGTAMQMYTDSMAQFLQGNKLPDDSSLESTHEAEKAKAIDLLQSKYRQQIAKYCDDADAEDNEQLHDKFEECKGNIMTSCDRKLEKMKEDNKMTREGEEAKARNQLAPAQNLYRAAIKKLADEVKDLPELETRAQEAREASKKLIRDNVDRNNGDLQETLLDDLEKMMDTSYTEILDYFKLKQEEDNVTVKGALDTASKFYNEQMAKHFKSTEFIQPEKLKKLNAEIVEASVSNCMAQVKLTPSQEQQLRQSMAVVFLKFEDENFRRVPHSCPAIGIDLGTTYSCVAVYHNNKVSIIPNEQNKNTTPSYVAFQPSGEISVGDPAKSQAHANPKNTIFDSKRLIGRQFDDPDVQRDMKLWPFEVVKEIGIPKIRAQGKLYHPEEISAKILAYLKKCAEKYLEVPVKNAVITVPAYFKDGQRQATKDAAEIAGLNVLKIINEPTAAAIAYKLHRTDDLQRRVLIFDLGGGTFDVAVVTMTSGALDVKAVGGDTHLEGEDFDHEMVQFCLNSFGDFSKDQHTKNETDRQMINRNLRRLRTECEKQKINLSGAQETDVEVDNIWASKDLSVHMTRKSFEQLNQAHFDKCIKIVESVLVDAKMTKKDIDDIVLVGGSTGIPKVQEMLSQYFEGKALNRRINPDEAVAIGAAHEAAVLEGAAAAARGDTKLASLAPASVAVQDVTPRSLGIEIEFGVMSVLIPRQSQVPCERSDTYATTYNNQTSVQIVIYEGESPKAIENTLVGEFYLNGIPPGLAGQHTVKVIMRVNTEGIISITASCVQNGVENELTVWAHKKRLSQKDVERLAAA